MENVTVSIPLVIGLVLIGVALGAGYVLWFGNVDQRARREFKRVIEAISSDHLRDVVLPDSVDGHIQIDHLLLTAKGLLVLEVKEAKGAIFAAGNMDEWTVFDGTRRYTIRNPQGPLTERVVALRTLTSDVPVEGRILFMPGAKFRQAKPDDVAFLSDLRREFEVRPGSPSKAIEAFYSEWERLRKIAHAV